MRFLIKLNNWTNKFIFLRTKLSYVSDIFDYICNTSFNDDLNVIEMCLCSTKIYKIHNFTFHFKDLQLRFSNKTSVTNLNKMKDFSQYE